MHKKADYGTADNQYQWHQQLNKRNWKLTEGTLFSTTAISICSTPPPGIEKALRCPRLNLWTCLIIPVIWRVWAVYNHWKCKKFENGCLFCYYETETLPEDHLKAMTCNSTTLHFMRCENRNKYATFTFNKKQWHVESSTNWKSDRAPTSPNTLVTSIKAPNSKKKKKNMALQI